MGTCCCVGSGESGESGATKTTAVAWSLQGQGSTPTGGIPSQDLQRACSRDGMVPVCRVNSIPGTLVCISLSRIWASDFKKNKTESKLLLLSLRHVPCHILTVEKQQPQPSVIVVCMELRLRNCPKRIPTAHASTVRKQLVVSLPRGLFFSWFSLAITLPWVSINWGCILVRRKSKRSK